MKIAVIASYGKSLVQFRGRLIEDLVSRGADVLAMGPDHEPGAAESVEKLGARFRGYELARASLNPANDLRTYRNLRKILAEEKPDVVLSYTAKPMVYGSLAAKKAGVPRILSMVTGLGYAFSGTGLKQWILRTVQLFLYRKAFRHNAKVIFQNGDDRQFFESLGVVRKSQTEVVHGSGIDLNRFAKATVPDGSPVFLMIARLLTEKGVAEYLEAAKKVVKTGDKAGRFILIGGEDPNPGGLNADFIKKNRGPVEWVGEQQNVFPFLNECTCYVLPSYREGTPRSTLEALAVGRPVITTDAVGCRETVIEGKNGFLVPIQNSDKLADAMRKVMSLKNAELQELGNESRKLAEEKFDVELVNREMIRFIEGKE